MKVGLRREDALCRSKWSVGVNEIVAGWRPPSLVGDATRFYALVSLSPFLAFVIALTGHNNRCMLLNIALTQHLVAYVHIDSIRISIASAAFSA